MKWYLLKQNKCPACGADLAATRTINTFTGERPPPVRCGNPDCDFRISEDRMTDIINGMVKKDLEDEPDRSKWDI